MVEVKELTKRYGKNLALDNISFSINEGEILGLLGPNGAGKSTTMNIITGYISASSGEVEVEGFSISKDPNKVKEKIGYLPEQPPLYLDMTVKGYLSFVYNLKKLKFDKKAHIDEICEKVGISDVYDRTIRKLSKGYKQRIGIAQALLGYPPLIILDEPTVGLDPKQIISIRKLIKDLAKNHTVIFSSHMLNEVQMMCSRVVVINSGKIVADKVTDKIAEEISDSCSLVLHVEGDVSIVDKILKDIEGVIDVKNEGSIGNNIVEYIVEYNRSNDIRKTVFKEFAANGLPLLKLDVIDTNLEDAFLKLTEYSEDNGETKGLESENKGLNSLSDVKNLNEQDSENDNEI